jgi:LmbE family N-acetylglucosaminyl deacetylase
MRTENHYKNALVIVAHPDDEILWCGGTIMSYPYYDWFIISLCRGNDSDRAPKFFKSLNILNAKGDMGRLDDGPEQYPLEINEVKKAILELLPSRIFDLILTHNPSGEYTRHLRHEEVSQAVIELWYQNEISTKELWTFAYEDGNKAYLPRAESKAIHYKLSKEIWEQKYKIVTETYGFPRGGFEAETTPRVEAFWKFINPLDAFGRLKQYGKVFET